MIRKVYFKLFLLMIGAFYSCSYNVLLRPQISGTVMDIDSIALDNAHVGFIDCFNSDCVGEDKVSTNSNGNFILKKQEKKYYFSKPNRHSKPYFPFMLKIEKKNFKSDTINIKSFRTRNNSISIDTIYLKKIKKL